MPVTITTLPDPPSRTEPSTFSVKADEFLGALPAFVTETNSMGTELNAIAVTVNQQSLQVADAQAVVGCVKWVSGTTYAAGDLVWSPADFQTYRRKTAGAGTTDPASDSANYAQIVSVKRSGNYDTTLTVTGTTNVTLPTSGTLANTANVATAVTAPSQAQMEAATDTATRVNPAMVNFHPGVAKAWLKYVAATNTLTGHNITSVTDAATGTALVTLGTDFSSENYVITATVDAQGTNATHCYVMSQAAGTFTIVSLNSSGTVTDPSSYHAVCYGDQ